MNKRTWLVVIVAGIAAGASACESDPLETWTDALEGVYGIDTMTGNETACDVEGPSTLADAGDHVAVFGGSEPWGRWIRVIGCADPTDCRTRVARIRQTGAQNSVSVPFSYDFLKASPNALEGRMVTSGFSGQNAGQCTDAALTNMVLTRSADLQVRIESRSVVVDHPADAQGICWTNDTEKAASGKPCNRLEVVKATRIEAL